MANINLAVEADCPFCAQKNFSQWALELSYAVVRCNVCRLLFVNPMPSVAETDAAVRTGVHTQNALNLNVRSRRNVAKIQVYRKVFASMLPQLTQLKSPVIWIDVGAGYGETLEAVKQLLPPASRLVAIEPMKYKADIAQAHGLEVLNDYLAPSKFEADYISLIDIYSHVPDFWSLLQTLKSNLKPGGEIFIESGNLADLENRAEFPGELGLPDHLVFGGEKHFMEYLRKAGFEVMSIRRDRVDGIVALAKNIVKKLLGRPVKLALPYTSNYRQLKIRARLPLMAGEIS